MSHEQLKQILLDLPGVSLEYPFEKEMAVYRIDEADLTVGEAMFALVNERSQPVQLSLRSDPQLAITLRERYDEVQPGVNLHKKYWNTIVCAGQMTDDEIFDLIIHSYQLVNESLSA